MPTLIKILPEIVQNKIAAGEVIERPASVVKELCENAIDAGAAQITVEIENGGGDLIRVTDNGAGMSAANLEICVERHATSKIREVDDIFKISTLGFRGEALPSIGAVARLTIDSGETPEREACRLTIAGGVRERKIPASPRRGTMVEVRELFFNTPARRKFMKSPAAETAQIAETLTRLALGYPEKSFYLISNGRRSLELPAAADLRARLADLFGDTFSLLPVAYADHGIKITGFIAAPPESRANSRQIYTLLNRRWFRHNGLLRAVADACAGNLPPRRFPLAALNFAIDPERVDINAHPTKEIIRFENEQTLIGGAHHAIQTALRVGGMPVAIPEELRGQMIRDAVETYGMNAVRGINGANLANRAPTAAGSRNSRSGFASGDFFRRKHLAEIPADVAANTEFAPNPPADTDANAENSTGENPLIPGGKWHYLGQAGGKYLVVETPDGLLLVDSHALHERYNYERLKNRAATIMRQELLMPVTLELTAAESGALDLAIPLLREFGFGVKISADQKTLTLTACPEFLRAEQLTGICRDILTADAAAPLAQYRDNLLAKIACHSSVRFGATLATESCVDLLDKLLSHNLPTCPHGRPTSITLTWEELARKFGR